MSASEDEYGSMSGSSLPSDFGECVAEYECDSDGEPINPIGKVSKSYDQPKKKDDGPKDEDPE